MNKQLKNIIRAYLCTIMLVVYIIGVVTIANCAPHKWQQVLVVITGIVVMYLNLYLIE